MESIQAIKTRLHSIASTQQITKSMQMISTTKVQKTLRRMQDNEPFLENNLRLIRSLARFEDTRRHRYITPPKELKSSLVIAISANRGLCGAYNVNVCRETMSQINNLNGSVQCLTVGGKVNEYVRRRKIPIERMFEGASESPLYESACEIGNVALEMYGNTADKILLVYTKYESALSHVPVTTQLLPIPRGDAETGDHDNRLMTFEPGADAVLDKIVPLYVSAVIFGAMLNAASSEQSARIMSMDAAARNCGDMLDRLSLHYNRLRQNNITQELNEIVSGAQALQAPEEG
jgi:F-type H+-transporting ATPase subunit gamma